MTIKDVKKMWILVESRWYSTTEMPNAWKAFVKKCKLEHKSVEQAYEELRRTYEYRKSIGA